MPFEYDFGKNFINTVLRIQDRKQRESQFGRELAQRTKQQGLLNILRERTLAQDESQFKRSQMFRQGQQEDLTAYREDVVANQARSATTAERRAKTGEEQLEINRGLLGVAETKAEAGRTKAENAANKPPATIGTTIATIDNNLKDLKKYYGDPNSDERTEDEVEIRTGANTFADFSYGEAKQKAQRDLTKGMIDAKVPIDGKVANYIRGFIDDTDTATQKRAIMGDALNEAINKFNLTQTQITILKLWIETGTR